MRKSRRTLALGPGDSGAGEPRRRDSERWARAELDSGAILDVSIEMLLACFGVCIAVTLPVWLPFMIWNERFLGSEDLDVLLSIGFIQAVPEAIALTASSYVIGRHYLGQDAGSAVSVLLRALPGILLVVVPWLLLANLSVVCCLPFFVLMWLGVLIPPVLIFETLPGKHGFFGFWVHTLPRAFQLARGWKTFGRFLLWFLVVRLVFGSLLTTTIAGWSFPELREEVARIAGLPGDGLKLIFLFINSFLTAVTSALLAATATVHYFDLRTRKEGFDLQVHLRRAQRELEERHA